MTVERDIAGFALPFAAGVLLASLSSTATYYPVCASIMPALLLSCMLISRDENSLRIRAGIIIAAFATGMFCFCNAAVIQITDFRSEGHLRKFAHECCIIIQQSIDTIPFRNETTSAIIKALLTGEKSMIPHDITEAFRLSGAAHILALSGMHLGIIYGIASKVLSLAGNNPKTVIVRSSVIICICSFYTLAVGAGDSIVRALLFIILNEICRLTHRRRCLKQTLLAALIIQLAASPLSISSVGFQLSYAAMAGIAFIHPWLSGFWPDDGRVANPFRKIWETASMSISCQITTGPLAWHYFKSFPIHFLLTNLIALPLTGLMIPTALATLVLHAAGICPGFMVTATEALVTALTYSLDIIARM